MEKNLSFFLSKTIVIFFIYMKIFRILDQSEKNIVLYLLCKKEYSLKRRLN